MSRGSPLVLQLDGLALYGLARQILGGTEMVPKVQNESNLTVERGHGATAWVAHRLQLQVVRLAETLDPPVCARPIWVGPTNSDQDRGTAPTFGNCMAL